MSACRGPIYISDVSEEIMPYKFEKLDVWQLALEYTDTIYQIGEQLPGSENLNPKSQITRAATSIALNIAEGSTSQSEVLFAKLQDFRGVHKPRILREVSPGWSERSESSYPRGSTPSVSGPRSAVTGLLADLCNGSP
jgi:hypothetical protein